MVLGVIDLGRAIFDKEVLSDLARTGSNLASRGPCDTLTACLTTAANAVMTQPSDLNMSAKGAVIITAVRPTPPERTTIIGQVSQGSISGQQQGRELGRRDSSSYYPGNPSGEPDDLCDGSLLYIYADNADWKLCERCLSIDVV